MFEIYKARHRNSSQNSGTDFTSRAGQLRQGATASKWEEVGLTGSCLLSSSELTIISQPQETLSESNLIIMILNCSSFNC